MASPDRKDVFIILRVFKEDKKHLEEKARKEGITLSELVRELIEDGFKYRDLQ